MCDRVHGHNWRVQTTVKVNPDQLNAVGMGVDFRELEEATRDAVADFEHRNLNELPEFRETAPTAECIARLIGDRITAWLSANNHQASLHEVVVWEMPEYQVIYRP